MVYDSNPQVQEVVGINIFSCTFAHWSLLVNLCSSLFVNMLINNCSISTHQPCQVYSSTLMVTFKFIKHQGLNISSSRYVKHQGLNKSTSRFVTQGVHHHRVSRSPSTVINYGVSISLHHQGVFFIIVYTSQL